VLESDSIAPHTTSDTPSRLPCRPSYTHRAQPVSCLCRSSEMPQVNVVENGSLKQGNEWDASTFRLDAPLRLLAVPCHSSSRAARLQCFIWCCCCSECCCLQYRCCSSTPASRPIHLTVSVILCCYAGT
jgi:hypothetical protein